MMINVDTENTLQLNQSKDFKINIMDYYDKKNIRTAEAFKQSLILLAYIIIFWTLWEINVTLFSVCITVFIMSKIFNINIVCKLFGHIESNKPKHGIIRCKRCNYPLFRVK